MTPEETRWTVGNQELLAIIDAFQHWRHYLTHTAYLVLVLTDYLNLKFIRTKKKYTPRHLR